MPGSKTSSLRVASLSFAFGHYREPAAAPEAPTAPTLSDPMLDDLAYFLRQQRQLEDQLANTPLTRHQRTLLGALRQARLGVRAALLPIAGSD